MSNERRFGKSDGPTTTSRDSQEKKQVEKAAQGSGRDPRLTVELPPDLKDRFDEAVEVMGVTKKSVVVRAVRQFCEYAEEQGGPDYFG